NPGRLGTKPRGHGRVVDVELDPVAIVERIAKQRYQERVLDGRIEQLGQERDSHANPRAFRIARSSRACGSSSENTPGGQPAPTGRAAASNVMVSATLPRSSGRTQ